MKFEREIIIRRWKHARWSRLAPIAVRNISRAVESCTYRVWCFWSLNCSALNRIRESYDDTNVRTHHVHA
jgi:hypothetical protein